MSMSARHQDALANIGCPKCKTRKGAMCKRLTESATPWKMDYERQEWVRTVHQPGEPLRSSVHTERLYALDRARARAAFLKLSRERQEAAMLTAELRAAADALRQYDRAEVEAIRTWLKTNWRVLVAPGSAAPAPADRDAPVP